MSRIYKRGKILLSDHFSQSITTKSRKPFDSIPGPKPLPLLGNIWRYFPVVGNYRVETLYENARYNMERYGPIVREQLTNNHTILHLFDPSDIESLFRQDSKYPHRRSHRALLKYRRDRPNLYNDGGLFPENGERWYRQRKLFDRHLMSRTRLSKLISNIDNMSLCFVHFMKESPRGRDNLIEINEFEQLLYKFSLSVILNSFLDVDIGSYETKFIDEMMQQLHHSLSAIERTEVYTDQWIKNPDKCPHYKMLSKSQEFLYTFVSQVIESLPLEPSNQDNLSLLQEWLHKDKLDKLDVISFVIDLLMAGFHTTSYTLAFLLYHIAKNPKIQESLQNEVNAHLPIGKSTTIDNLDNLLLMRNCLKESLRLNPVSIGTGRVTCDEIIIRDYVIPPGTMIITQNQIISRDENIFRNADKFDPERWVYYRSCPENEKPSPFASLPFGFGVRSCLGQRLVELQIKLFTARLLQEFNLQSSVSEIPTKTTIIHVIAGHFRMVLRQKPHALFNINPSCRNF